MNHNAADVSKEVDTLELTEFDHCFNNKIIIFC